ncbi:hypothetical protein CCO02nite_30610 [Cellulomonas composti]|uniref:Uncharacterized protein n=1 Tax=Cellulomonas composti TaxID=266130 RepID=A0A511JFA5_9CELL|nr:hypothetical protein CCO02nite_30610 [Cellulomonas composti]
MDVHIAPTVTSTSVERLRARAVSPIVMEPDQQRTNDPVELRLGQMLPVDLSCNAGHDLRDSFDRGPYHMPCAICPNGCAICGPVDNRVYACMSTKRE